MILLTLLSYKKTPRFSREDIDISVYFSHHGNMFTPKTGDKKSQVGKIAILIHFNSENKALEIKHVRNNPDLPMLAKSIYTDANQLFRAITTYTEALGLDIQKILFAADGNLGYIGEDKISEHLLQLIELFSPKPEHLFIFTNTVACLRQGKSTFPESTTIESKRLGATLLELFGAPTPASHQAIHAAAEEEAP